MPLALILLGFCFYAGCNPTSHPQIRTPQVCQKVFKSDGYDWHLVKSLMIDDLIQVEKCGFTHHPNISFYSEIVDSKQYQIPPLLTELRRTNDDLWRVRLFFLIKAVIDSNRFHTEVLRDRKVIIDEVNSAFTNISQDDPSYEQAHDLRDGIEMYFIK